MGFNREQEIEQIKKLLIVDFLRDCGYTPDHTQTDKAWFLSPFRKEKTPSFVVYTDRNDWYDYGAKIGGSIIDLTMKLFDLEYPEAMKMLRKKI